jgi:predicted O-methyltransferase YrrM
MHFITEALEDYVAKHSTQEPTHLADLNKETYQKILIPRMLSGHFQGRLLSMISKICQPKSILEVGTYTGYATLCLCEGLQQDGEIHTIDIKEELVDFQRKHFKKSPWNSQIKQHLGEALDIIPNINATFDLVFIDADKENYLQYYEMIVPKMNRGGLILSDNVLWSGKVLQPLQEGDKSTEVLLAYNKKLANDPRVESILLPIRDGITLTRVK